MLIHFNAPTLISVDIFIPPVFYFFVLFFSDTSFFITKKVALKGAYLENRKVEGAVNFVH